MLSRETQKLTFSFDMIPRKFKVSYTKVEDECFQMDESSSPSEVTSDLVQCHVDKLLARVTPAAALRYE